MSAIPAGQSGRSRPLSRIAGLLAMVFALLCGTAQAQAPPDPPSLEQRQAEQQAAWQAGMRAATRGPAQVPLLDQASLRLPKGMVFIPPGESSRILAAGGSRSGPDLVGLVTSPSDDDEWLVVVRFTHEGYIRDDEAKSWDAGEMLANLREGQAEGNKDRAARGFPELELLGWAEPPTYDPATHRLVWSLRVHAADQEADAVSANYNTRALGRDGYFSLNLVTDETRLRADRKVAATLLAGLEYLPGKRYEDFNATTDRVAEYGLAALIGVVAAKKLGLLALAGVALLKFGKLGALVLAGFGALAAKLFGRKKPPA